MVDPVSNYFKLQTLIFHNHTTSNKISTDNKMLLKSVALIFLLNSQNTQGAVVSRNGGYNLVIAVEEGTEPPGEAGAQAFITNVQETFNQFAVQLWQSTRQRFFLNSVELLIPQNWELPSDVATIQAYSTADFKVSEAFYAPRVENPNLCGVAGQHVELPFSFFNSTEAARYGNSGKALVNLFARFRFGVWEEHGNIGDDKFPYFHIQPSITYPKWTFTGCSENIEGSITHLNGEECDVLSETGPGKNCRFVPAEENTVNSSLAFVSWPNSINEFCDETTHNHEAPNRMNHFCGHRSVWDVIRESEDYFTTVGKPLENMPQSTFRVVSTSPKPLLYVLLDRGRTSTNPSVLEEVVDSLKNFMNQTYLNPTIVAAVGSYPYRSSGRSHAYVNNDAEWSTIEHGFGGFSTVIQDALEHHDGPVVRDFGQAIQEVAEKIRARNHAAGAILLVVKRGATQNSFEQMTYFGSVLPSLQNQKLRLFAIELQQNEKTPYINLASLASLTQGNHHIVNETTNVREKIDSFLAEVKQALEINGFETEERKTWTIFKGFAPLKRALHIPILEEGIRQITICVTTKKHIPESEIVIRQVEGTPLDPTPPKTRKDEWNEIADESKRSVTILTASNPHNESVWEILINNCTSQVSDDCAAFVDISLESDETTPSHKLDITVQTSAENNYLDFDRRGAKAVPFSIFATLESDGQRVLGLEDVEATVVYENLRHWTIPLKDDGSGADVSDQDGIYSGVFTPPQNGLYKVFVKVTTPISNHVSGKYEHQHSNAVANLLGFLLPQDQSEFGCYSESLGRLCFGSNTTKNLAKVGDMVGTIFVENSITFSPRPMRIVDFEATPLPNFGVRFGFTAPKIIGIDGARADSYKIRMSSSAAAFIRELEQTMPIADITGVPPGEYVSLDHTNMQTATTAYFAVETVFRNQRGDISNIVGTVINEDGVAPVPQPTTTTTTPQTTTEEESTTQGTTHVPSTTSTTTRPPVTPTSTSTQRPTTARPTTKRPNSGSRIVTEFPLWIAVFLLSVYL